MRTHFRALVGLAALCSVVLAGCAAPVPPSTGTDHATATAHVHAIIADPFSPGYLLGTHSGIYTASAEGQLGARVGDSFDAMALTSSGNELLASGHPGADTPTDWGTPNLGVIRSSNGAKTWEAVAFSGEKDFHSLASAPDGTVFGQATDSAELMFSPDMGDTWLPTGASLQALGLAIDATGRILAITRDSVQASNDLGATFAVLPETPALYVVSASSDRQLIVGVDTTARMWVTTAGSDRWREVGIAHGAVQAITISDTGQVLVVDDSGLTMLPATK